MLDYEMATNAENLKSIVDQGKEMAAAGHFDSASILKAVQDFDRRSGLAACCLRFLFVLLYCLYYTIRHFVFHTNYSNVEILTLCGCRLICFVKVYCVSKKVYYLWHHMVPICMEQ